MRFTQKSMGFILHLSVILCHDRYCGVPLLWISVAVDGLNKI